MALASDMLSARGTPYPGHYPDYRGSLMGRILDGDPKVNADRQVAFYADDISRKTGMPVSAVYSRDGVQTGDLKNEYQSVQRLRQDDAGLPQQASKVKQAATPSPLPGLKPDADLFNGS